MRSPRHAGSLGADSVARLFSSASTLNVRPLNSVPPFIIPWRNASKRTLRLFKPCLPLSATKVSESAKSLERTPQRQFPLLPYTQLPVVK